jgi:hypothetical protein
MKIVFDDKSFIECKKSETPDKIIITISAKDGVNPLKKIINSCELTTDEFKQLISEVL